MTKVNCSQILRKSGVTVSLPNAYGVHFVDASMLSPDDCFRLLEVFISVTDDLRAQYSFILPENTHNVPAGFREVCRGQNVLSMEGESVGFSAQHRVVVPNNSKIPHTWNGDQTAAAHVSLTVETDIPSHLDVPAGIVYTIEDFLQRTTNYTTDPQISPMKQRFLVCAYTGPDANYPRTFTDFGGNSNVIEDGSRLETAIETLYRKTQAESGSLERLIRDSTLRDSPKPKTGISVHLGGEYKADFQNSYTSAVARRKITLVDLREILKDAHPDNDDIVNLAIVQLPRLEEGCEEEQLKEQCQSWFDLSQFPIDCGEAGDAGGRQAQALDGLVYLVKKIYGSSSW
ncbi:uncharacterized protein PV07_12797 [Cladophialophora immunda]|uniref:Uncharacterized protein n=1 Tax=Cladophialophora immunda TaxID=569365 RepID=A0A0D2BTM4_9EURO|nr:uncharacterized protein PV07_12797 [Cladophialophora immunda]KIW21775.1 hypothetical protein PV07_12797 [Cladophialophora immunda]